MAETRLAKLEEQQKELADKIKKEKAKLRREERARDDKRKRIVGELVLGHYRDDDQIRVWLETLLDKEVTGNAERALFGLTPKPAAESSSSDGERAESGEGKMGSGVV
jgi:hypothetical protein